MRVTKANTQVEFSFPKPERVTANDLHTLVHFLADGTAPDYVYFSEVHISDAFPLELLQEACLSRKGIRCGHLHFKYSRGIATSNAYGYGFVLVHWSIVLTREFHSDSTPSRARPSFIRS